MKLQDQGLRGGPVLVSGTKVPPATKQPYPQPPHAVSGIAVCYSLTMPFVGMRFLNLTNRWLPYGREAALPFFVLHQPVIIVIAFFLVQWNVGIRIKLPVVVATSFVVSIGLCALLVRRIAPPDRAFGMK